MNLKITGYETVSFTDGQQVLDWLKGGGTADLAVVDVMLPKVDGFALLKPLTDAVIPVIYLTAMSDLESRLRGLTGGAEDYMVKPFEIPELLVRIDKVLKRYGRSDEIIDIDGLSIDTARHSVSRGGEDILLTPMEYDLLLVLARSRNIAMSRERLLHDVWGTDYEGETRTVDVHVAQLRKKTGLNIVSVPKVGYRLEVDGR